MKTLAEQLLETIGIIDEDLGNLKKLPQGLIDKMFRGYNGKLNLPKLVGKDSPIEMETLKKFKDFDSLPSRKDVHAAWATDTVGNVVMYMSGRGQWEVNGDVASKTYNTDWSTTPGSFLRLLKASNEWPLDVHMIKTDEVRVAKAKERAKNSIKKGSARAQLAARLNNYKFNKYNVSDVKDIKAFLSDKLISQFSLNGINYEMRSVWSGFMDRMIRHGKYYLEYNRSYMSEVTEADPELKDLWNAYREMNKVDAAKGEEIYNEYTSIKNSKYPEQIYAELRLDGSTMKLVDVHTTQPDDYRRVSG